jgi:hypothetical protein
MEGKSGVDHVPLELKDPLILEVTKDSLEEAPATYGRQNGVYLLSAERSLEELRGEAV